MYRWALPRYDWHYLNIPIDIIKLCRLSLPGCTAGLHHGEAVFNVLQIKECYLMYIPHLQHVTEHFVSTRDDAINML